MNKTPDIIVPQRSLVPHKQSDSGEKIDCLKHLATKTRLDIYLARGALEEAIAQTLRDIVLHPAAKSSPKKAELGGLYAGKGGKILSINPIPAELPPSYNGLTPLPPPPPFENKPSPPPKKRGRGSNEDTDDSGSGYTQKIEIMLAQHKEDIQSMLDQQKEGFENMLHQARDGARNELKKKTKKIMEAVARRISGLCSNTYSKEGVDDLIEEMKRESVDLIDETLDDRVLEIKVEVEDYMEEEIQNANQSLLDRFKAAVEGM